MTQSHADEDASSLGWPSRSAAAVVEPKAEIPPPSLSPPPAPRLEEWRWQLRNRIRTPEQLRRLFPRLEDPEAVARASARFPMAVTPYYASLIERCDASDPIFLQSVPQPSELEDPPCLKDDPLEEDEDMPVPGLVHRYPDRALVIATTTCAMYCRHCTRKRAAGQRENGALPPQRLRRIATYLAAHPQIRDVIISGGDPFTLPTAVLERVLMAVRSAPAVEIVRIGTRTPATLPMRITDELVEMLRRHHPLYVNLHFNHPRELTPRAAEACRRLADAGIPLGNQTVLLRGVNDDAATLETLFRALLRLRVRPYYLFQCDLVHGVEAFRTPVARGIEIMEYLRGRMSGLGIPTFVVDAPHGGGKIPLLPNYLVSLSPTHTVLRNSEGMIVAYPEPAAEAGGAPGAGTRTPPSLSPGVWEAAAGHTTYIKPEGTARHARRAEARGRAYDTPLLEAF